jgi:predicted porin
MKKITRCMIAAVAASLSAASHAQTTVTLYGIIDAGFAYVNNAAGGKLYTTSSGNLQGSRWGLRGNEDLGSGLNALFVLDSGFNVFNGRLGQSGDEFGRQAYVGLSSSRLGRVTLGRQYDSVVDFTGPLEAGSQWATFYGAHPGDLDNLNNSNRVNNAIKYTSPVISGFSVGALYSFGGVSGDFSRNQIWSVGAGYAMGPLTLGAGYLHVKDPNFSFFGNNALSSATASNMTGSPVYSGYASAGTQDVVSVGGSYVFGGATLGATYTNTGFKDLGQVDAATLDPLHYSGSERFHNAEANFKYQLTTSLLLGIGYDYTKGYGVHDVQYQQVMLGADYFLSKRTDLYVTGVYQHASGTDSTGGRAVAAMNFLTPSSTSSQLLTIAGIRHQF